MTKAGDGQLNLSGANTVSNVAVNAGTLIVEADGSLSTGANVNVASGTVLFQNTPTLGSATVGGAMTFGGETASVAVLNGGGFVNVGSSTTLSIDGGAFDGNLLGSGIVQKTSSAGTLTLNGANSNFFGVTTVSAGTLKVNGSLDDGTGITVESNGVLKGNGSVSNVVVQTGGVLSPGDGVESMAMTGGLTLNSDSDLVFEFRETTGTLDLDPGTGGIQSGAGVSWDLIDLGAGILDLGATPPATKINLYIDAWKQDNTGHATLAADNNFDLLGEYEWLFIKANDLSQWTGSGDINDYFAFVDNHNPTISDGALTGVGGVFDTAASNPFNRPLGSNFTVAWQTVGTDSGLYVKYSAIPEPGSMILCGLGAMGLGWYGRRRLKKQQPTANAAETKS